MNKDLVAIFEYLEREKGIKREIIITAIEDSLILAAKKSVQGVNNITVKTDAKTGNIEVFCEKEIVENVEYPEEEISLEEAEELEFDGDIGDFVQVQITPENFGRIAAQTAKQVISQKLRGAERDVIYEEYRHRVNEIVSGTIKRIVKGATLIVDLGKVEAILPSRFYPMTEKYNVGDRIQALLFEVKDTEQGGAEVILSRSHPEFVVELFKQEVPELEEKILEVKKVVREAGYRTKMSVSSNDPKVDPRGACVGVRGTRVKNIIRELNNEKIDIIVHSEDPLELLQKILEPIEIRKYSVDDESNTISIIVNDEDYPIVIGKRGMNARLNGRLVGYELDIKKMSDFEKEVSDDSQQLALEDSPDLDDDLQIEGINQFVIDGLKEAGFSTKRDLLNIPAKELAKAAEISIEMANDIMDKLRKKKV